MVKMRLTSKKTGIHNLSKHTHVVASSWRSHRTGQGSAAASSSHSPAGVLEDANEPVEGSFSHFSQTPKKCEGDTALECDSAPAPQIIHADRSSNGSGQFGRVWEPG